MNSDLAFDKIVHKLAIYYCIVNRSMLCSPYSKIFHCPRKHHPLCLSLSTMDINSSFASDIFDEETFSFPAVSSFVPMFCIFMSCQATFRLANLITTFARKVLFARYFAHSVCDLFFHSSIVFVNRHLKIDVYGKRPTASEYFLFYNSIIIVFTKVFKIY